MQNTHAINAKRYAPPFSLVVLASLDGDEKSKGRPFVAYHFRKHVSRSDLLQPQVFFHFQEVDSRQRHQPCPPKQGRWSRAASGPASKQLLWEASRLLTRRATSQVPVCRAQRLLNMAFPKKAKIRAHLILVFSESCKTSHRIGGFRKELRVNRMKNQPFTAWGG